MARDGRLDKLRVLQELLHVRALDLRECGLLEHARRERQLHLVQLLAVIEVVDGAEEGPHVKRRREHLWHSAVDLEERVDGLHGGAH
ncbi:hypothetical protein ACFPRL_22530 [Pseudoclavibacter helvolus]